MYLSNHSKKKNFSHLQLKKKKKRKKRKAIMEIKYLYL